MKYKFGIVSYNIYCNFTNYGSALQSWALCKAIKKYCKKEDVEFEPILVDYCPDVLRDKDPLNPLKNMWDKDEESIEMLKLSMPAIKENFYKFDNFYHKNFNRTRKKYTSDNFNKIITDESLDGFVCGSDTIFCIDEFNGFDDGYFANYDCMKNGYTISYAASFGDSEFIGENEKILRDRLMNFNILGIRESKLINQIKSLIDIPVEQTIDPTLLLSSDDYDELATKRLENKPYLLLYTRRYNRNMELFAERVAKEKDLKIIEISLRAKNKEKGHRMYYEAGVEEFLSLVKYADCVITNSFHGTIFGIQYKKPLYVFSREQCDTKINELLERIGLIGRKLINGNEQIEEYIDYEYINKNIENIRKKSIDFLRSSLLNYIEWKKYNGRK